MIWLLSALLVALAQVPQTPADGSFEQTSRQADEARMGGRLTDAIGLYREGLELRPGWTQGWWGLASIYYEQDRFPEARDSFEQFIETSEKEVAPAHAFQGLCEYETGDYSRAAEHLGLWVRKGLPGNDQLIDVASFHWALLLTREGQFVQALFLFEEKAKRHGVSPLLAEAMGLASLRMKNLPEDYPQERREMVWLAGKASAYASLHDYGRAREYADRLAARYPREPNVHYFRGMLSTFEKKIAEAAQEFREELSISPNHGPAMIHLAFLEMQESRLDEAIAIARRAVALEPKEAMARYTLGRVLLANRNFQESAAELEMAKDLAPASANVRFQLANAYRRLGRKAEAERESAMFEALKDKAEVLATPEDKLKGTPDEKGRGK
jgi:tetratricopeptide (TPR) repeat protein